MAMNLRKGFRFTPYEAPDLSPFEKLFDIFQELSTHTSGDFDEALPLSDLLPEFIVEPEEIQEARNELDGGHELSHTDSEIGCFSIY